MLLILHYLAFQTAFTEVSTQNRKKLNTTLETTTIGLDYSIATLVEPSRDKSGTSGTCGS